MDTFELGYTLQMPTPDAEGTVDDGHALFMGLGFGSLGLGFGAQWLTKPNLGGALSRYRKYTLAAAFGDGETVSLGLGYNFFGSDTSERLDALESVDFGMQWRLSRYLGLSIFGRDLNAPFLREGEALPRRFGAGVAFRAWNGRFIIDQEFTHVQNSGQLRVSPRLVVEPLAGLRLFGRGEWAVSSGSVAGDSGLVAATMGLELSLGFTGVQSGVHVTNVDTQNKLTGHSHSMWISANKQRSLVNFTQEWILVDLSTTFSELPVSGLFGPSAKSYAKLLIDLDRMSADPTVKGIILNIAGPGLGYAQAWELRQRMQALRAKGKKIVALLQSSGTKAVYLANGADKIYMPPNTTYEPNGLSGQLVNYQGILKKFGINAEFLRVRDYKTAPEAFVNRVPSPQSLEQTGEYLDALFKTFISSFADRKKDAATATAMVDNVPLMPLEAKSQGWIDDVIYPDELKKKVEKTFNTSIILRRQYTRLKSSEYKWNTKPEIAIVVVDGSIVQGSSGSSPIGDESFSGSSSIVGALERLKKDSNVKAIILRVNSPGGSALASDVIYRELRRAAQKKPVIASMGNYAASGGYYVAAGAEEIYATPVTLTGSIGIFAGKFSVQKLANDYGVTITTLARGKRAGGFSIFTPFTPQQKKALSKYLAYLYRLFLQQAANTRPLTADQIDKYARGRVWTGKRAAELKLVDKTGSLIDAIRQAEKLTGLSPYEAQVNIYPKSSGGIGAGLSASVTDSQLLTMIAPHLGLLQTPKLLKKHPILKHLSTLERSVFLLLRYNNGEALMLPPVAIDIQ